MTNDELRVALYNFRYNQAKVTYSKGHPEGLSSPQFYDLQKELELILACLDLLDDKESIIISNHLIQHKTWNETIDILTNKYGRHNLPSDRTLKRMQNRALSKMSSFINEVTIQ